MCLFIVVLYMQRSRSLIFASLVKHQNAVSVSDSVAELQFLFFAPQVLDT